MVFGDSLNSMYYNNNNNNGTFLPYTKDSPLIITVTGRATIPKKAERAVLHVVVSATGESKQRASDEVTTTAKHIRKILEAASAQDDSREAKEAAVIAHWNMTRLSSTSRQPIDDNGRAIDSAAPIFDVSLSFNIRVKMFSALGALAARLSSMARVSLNSIEWVLTADTQKYHESELRHLAAADALQQAKDYGKPLGITKFRPVAIDPVSATTSTQSNQMLMQMQQQQQPPGVAFSRSRGSHAAAQFGASRSVAQPGSDPLGPLNLAGEAESDLAFYPEDIHMNVTVQVKFLGE